MRTFTKTLIAASVAAATLAASGAAMAEFSGNIGATSNYLWRGVTQSGDDSAISGGIDYAHDSGVYAGAWTSSIAGSGSEVDYYAGYAGEVAGFGYDVNLTAYTYPQQEDWDFTELGLSGSYSYFTVGYARTIAADADEDTGSMFVKDDQYYYASVDYPLAEDMSVGATVGSYKFTDDGVGNADLDYTHYQLALTKSAGDMGDFTFAYDKNSIDDDETTTYQEDSGRLSVSWAKSF